MAEATVSKKKKIRRSDYQYTVFKAMRNGDWITRLSFLIMGFGNIVRKQFVKGINQIAQEGAIQIFQEFNTGMEEIIVGVVGVLQFEVLTYRLKNEYNVDVRLEQLPFEYIRWVENPEEVDVAKIQGTSDMKRICDLKGNPLLLFINSWSVGMVEERNPNLKLSEFGKN